MTTGVAKSLTHSDWWAALDKNEACLSALVIEEISRGDRQAAQNRLTIAQGLRQVDQTPEAASLALRMIEAGLVPRTEPEDALHIALATVHQCRFLVSWNFAHFVGLNLAIAWQLNSKLGDFLPLFWSHLKKSNLENRYESRPFDCSNSYRTTRYHIGRYQRTH